MFTRMLLALAQVSALVVLVFTTSTWASTHSIDPAALYRRPIPHSSADPSYNTTVHHFGCGTSINSHGTSHFINTLSSLHSAELSSSSQGSSGSTRARLALRSNGSTSKITVPLYMHIVTTAAKKGTIPSSMVQSQVTVLNKVYNAYNVNFQLAGVDYTSNDAWAIGATTEDDTNMKTALRRGTYSSLNLYLQTDLVGGILGKCSLPTDVGTQPSPNVYVTDGCNIAAGSMPGGNIQGYNLGMTAVHETGHWLGLLHTFEGYSCSSPGDYVADTAVEAASTDGCPTAPWKNTCPRLEAFYQSGRKGDPIRNYMDYSTDACYSGFTDGQVARWRQLFGIYRNGN